MANDEFDNRLADKQAQENFVLAPERRQRLEELWDKLTPDQQTEALLAIENIDKCQCRQDFTDGTPYCEECGKRR